MGEIDGINIIKLDIITSVSKPYPEAYWEIVNNSTKKRNYKISEEAGFFIGSDTTTKEVIFEHYLSLEGDINGFFNVNTNRDGELMSITIPAAG